MTTKQVQLLTFTLGREVYALDVGQTREVVDYLHVTPIPKTPAWIRGVFNLRGSVVPVLDLKQKLSMGATEKSRDACVLILEILLGSERTLVGVLADSVREVIELSTSEIEATPNFGSRVSTEYIRGVGRRNGELFVVLDVERIFADDEIEALRSSTEQPTSSADASSILEEAPAFDADRNAQPVACFDPSEPASP